MKIKKTFQGELPENRIVNTYSNSLTDAYSANYLNDKLNNVEVSSTEPTNGKDIWVQMGKNLFDKNSGVVSGVRYDSSGVISAHESGFCQETYISVQPNTSYVFSTEVVDRYRVCEYDKDKKFLTRFIPDVAVVSCVFTTGPSTKFIRVSGTIDTLDSLQIEQGEFKTDYEPYIPKKIYVKKDEKYELVYDEANTRKEVYVGSTEPKSGEEIWIRKGKNLFDARFTDNMYALTKSGNVFSFNSTLPYGEFDYFGEFEIGKPYTFSFEIVEASASLQYFAFFFYADNTYDFKVITTGNIGRHSLTVTPTKEVIYAKVRFFGGSSSQRSGKVKNVQIEQNTTATDFEEFADRQIFVKNSLGNYDEFVNENNSYNIYSNDEQRVGRWTNGQPIFRKVIDCGYMVAGSKTVNHGIPDVDVILSARGFFHNLNTGTWFPIPRAYPTDGDKFNVAVDVGKENIYLTSGTNYNGTTFYARIILEYTRVNVLK